MKALVIGESLIDVVTSSNGTVVHRPGGSPLNVAVGLGRLGHDVSFVTDLGADDDAVAIRTHLRASRVNVNALGTGATSRATAVLADDGSARYDFALRWDPHVEDGATTHKRWDAVHIGSISAFLSPGAAAVDRLLDQCSEPGTIRVFDPNIRPSIIGSRSTALTRVEHLLACTDVLKLSDEDADWLLPDTEIDDQIDYFLARDARLVALTRGADGAVLSTASARVSVGARSVEVTDTIGAGDSFTSALIDALGGSIAHQGSDLGDGSAPTCTSPPRWSDLDEDALSHLGERATAAAAITVSRPGADPPWMDELRDHDCVTEH